MAGLLLQLLNHAAQIGLQCLQLLTHDLHMFLARTAFLFRLGGAGGHNMLPGYLAFLLQFLLQTAQFIQQTAFFSLQAIDHFTQLLLSAHELQNPVGHGLTTVFNSVLAPLQFVIQGSYPLLL